MDVNSLIQSLSKYQPISDYDCNKYKFGFIYHRILGYAIENNYDIDIKLPTFKGILKDLHSFSMRVISRSITIYLNNLYKDQKHKYGDFPLFFEHYKKDYACKPNNFIEFFNIFKQALIILYNYYNQMLNNYTYILKIIENNKYAIMDKFSINECDFRIASLDLNKGDKHNDGLGTASFEIDGNTFFIKWKDPRAEINHQYLFEYFKEAIYGDSEKIDLNILILDKLLYIQKAIEIEEVNSIDNYFRNVGIFLFVTYLISGSDFHYENIVSTYNTIVTIDSENIFNIKEDFTVYDTALIPSFSIREKTLAAFSNNFDGDLDILNYEYRITQQGIETIEKVEKKVSNNMNVPLYKGKELLFYLNKDLIIEGFEKAYNFFLENTKNIINLIKKLFTDVQIRVIKKPTYVYSDAIWSSYSPKLLTDLDCRKEFFRKLSIFDEDEIEFLLLGNIPYKSKKIKIKEDYFNKFDNRDKNRQIKFIVESYILEYIRKNRGLIKEDKVKDPYHYENIDIDQIFSYCYKNLLDKSLIDNNNITWLEIVEKGNERYKDFEIDYMPNTLYYGKTGIFLFLLKYIQHYEIAKEQKKELLNQIQCFIENFVDDIKKLPDIQNGILDGAAGLLYLLTEFKKEVNVTEKDIVSLAELLSKNVIYDKSFDIVSGSVGLLKILIKMYEDSSFCSFNNTLLKCILRVKDYLVVNYYRNNGICGWPSKGLKDVDISLGYSHGLAGYLPVLYKCANLLNDNTLHSIVDEGIEFLISQHNRTSKNWPCSVKNTKELVNWCHGSPGILLCMIELFNYGYNRIDLKSIIMDNIPILLETEKESFSLCHGSFGNNFIGLYIAYSLKNKILYDRFLNKILSDFRYYFTKDKINFMNKSFMTGYSGILYIYLKFKELNIIN
ncbi:hypothetical protein AF2641_05345 [Anoxybacillus flavithermus]|nr:hypothetical protein AF2641_05345 [Anoxybacillus flavithermus]